MSHRVTTQTEIKDKSLAMRALKSAGYSYVDQGTSLLITSGPMNTATIDLTSGVVAGDTDRHRRGDDSLGALKQHYAEAKYRAEMQKQGHDIVSRVVDKNGDIVLHCKASFG